MTIDEALEKCKYGLNFTDEEHDQLAEWLEELKAYRASIFSGDMTQAMLKEERNKAIDDFKFEVKRLINELGVIRFKDIDEIAEQLKVGEENGN